MAQSKGLTGNQVDFDRMPLASVVCLARMALWLGWMWLMKVSCDFSIFDFPIAVSH